MGLRVFSIDHMIRAEYARAGGALVQHQTIDDRVLELRSQGRSHGAIARELGLHQPRDAHDAFRRAVRRRPAPEQTMLRNQEQGRLDELSEQIRALPHLTAEQVAAQLRVVARLRRELVDR
jgi:hypothetical protein